MREGEILSFGEHVALVFESLADDKEATVVGPRTARKLPVEPIQAAAPVAKSHTAPRPSQAESVTGKKKFPGWVIALIVIILVSCACIGIIIGFDPLGIDCSIPIINSFPIFCIP
jgi:hypothetical protein